MGREWGRNGQGEVSLRATWGQGGRGRITPKERFQVSKRNLRGTDKETSKGSKKGELRHNLILSIYVCVYNNCVNAADNLNVFRL
jgi:hypothetical protein